MGVSLRIQSLEKSFTGVRVLDAVDFDLRGGEVHTLMGENGAGKSTLMKIIAGVHQPDRGTIWLDDQAVSLASPHAALRQGIALIHQEPLSFPDLSVAENIFIGRGMPKNRAGLLDWSTMHRRARELLAALGVDLDPKAKVRGLSVALQQMVELAAALSQQARILLMDEPTAALTPREVEDLFRIVRQLRDQQCAIVFISHRLPEVFGISDRITVLRDGQCVGTRTVSQTTPEEIIRMMVGRDLGQLYERAAVPAGKSLLSVAGFSRRGCFQDISFELRAGEIVGLAGLVGAGRTDVGQALFGIAPADQGIILRNSRPAHIRSPQDAAGYKIAYVPEDRQRHGLFPPMSIAANIAMADLPSVSRLSWLSSTRQHDLAETWRDKLGIRLRHVEQPARELSGGNQQKVVLAKWLQTGPEVLILDEPTRGIDVGAKAEVHRLMADLARQGKAILMISSDLPEVLAMSDRVLVMREGRLTGEFDRAQATQENIMAAATGQGQTAAPASARRKAGTSAAAKWMRFRELGIAVVVLLVVVIASIMEPRFLSPESLRSVLNYIPLIVVIAMGQMMVIVTRNIDLSVGSVLGLAAIVVGNLFITYPDMPLVVAALLAALIGGALGLFNGVLVAFLRMPSIIATLGTLTACRGLIFIYSHGKQVDPDKIPAALVRLSQTSPVGIPWIVIYAAVIAVITALWLRYTRTGREIFAVGSNPPAAVLRGINVRRILLLVFTITGACSGFAGILYASRFGYVNPNEPKAMELIVISAVVIGGTNVFGGSGSVLGTVLGCLLLGLIYVALPMIGVSTFWQLAVYGLAILLAATTDTLIQRRSGLAAEAV